MRIAVLAWGSLVWQPANDFGEISVTGPWREDGPTLPVEFARISSDDRLTLVVVPGYTSLSTVLWAPSTFDTMTEAVANLAERETGTSPDRIHGVGPDGAHSTPDARIAATVSAWVTGRDDVDAAVWTGLGPGSRWGEDGWGIEHAYRHVASLTGATRDRALRYIRNAPPRIDTPVRRALDPLVYPTR